MTLFGVIFYILAAVTVMATAMAITRRNAVHAVVYLILSFLSTALIFYLLGAPFLAALEVIIYAGAIMVLFLFIIMMLRLAPSAPVGTWRQWSPAVILGGISFVLCGIIIAADPGTPVPLRPGYAAPAQFGRFVFQHYWFPVEIASFLLLIALVGALYLGRREAGGSSGEGP